MNTLTIRNQTLKILIGIALALFLVFNSFGQTQVIKGKIIDAQAEYELIGATILVLGASRCWAPSRM